MYEENLTPLPAGDATLVFAEQLRQVNACLDRPRPITAEDVVQMADRSIQPLVGSICRRLLLPGSTIEGWENLKQLAEIAQSGESCILCSSHRSNLDVPTLYALLEDQADLSVFHQIIWLAGRKLSEESALIRALVQSVNRIVLTPHSWFDAQRSEEEVHEAHRINLAAQRQILRLRHENWVFGLFPSGTRMRPGDKSTTEAIAETDTYLKTFQHMVLCDISGCTLPVNRDGDMTHEIPKTDRVTCSFGPVQSTDRWRASALARFPDLEQRQATARAIMEDIAALGKEHG